MKTTLLTALLFSFFISFSQTAENSSFVLSYENNLLKITNKLSCTAEVRINYTKGGMPKDTTVMISGFDTYVQFVENATQLKIKSSNACGQNGWLQLTVDIVVICFQLLL